MTQYQFKVQLLRNKEIIKEATVWEFDDDCLQYNLFVQALIEFEDIMQDKDIIKVHGYKTEYIEYNAIDETYTVVSTIPMY
jgi:glycogen synthase